MTFELAGGLQVHGFLLSSGPAAAGYGLELVNLLSQTFGEVVALA